MACSSNGPGHVHACDLAPTLREQPREAPCPGAKVHNTRAGAHDTDRREAIEQFRWETRTVTGVVIGRTAEIAEQSTTEPAYEDRIVQDPGRED